LTVPYPDAQLQHLRMYLWRTPGILAAPVLAGVAAAQAFTEA
jgi:hypothetical protein